MCTATGCLGRRACFDSKSASSCNESFSVPSSCCSISSLSVCVENTCLHVSQSSNCDNILCTCELASVRADGSGDSDIDKFIGNGVDFWPLGS